MARIDLPRRAEIGRERRATMGCPRGRCGRPALELLGGNEENRLGKSSAERASLRTLGDTRATRMLTTVRGWRGSA